MDVVIDEDLLPKDPFTEEAFIKSWEDYISELQNNGKKIMASILEMNKGQADLSRRAVVYHLAGLSFREYLNLTLEEDFSVMPLSKILSDHHALASAFTDNLDILKLFKKYLKS